MNNWRKQNPDKVRKYWMKSKYGLSPEEYSALMSNGCAVCGTMDGLCIDHNHDCCPTERSCGKCVRGVLCHRHNKAEGFFKDVDEIMALAMYRIQFESVLGVK